MTTRKKNTAARYLIAACLALAIIGGAGAFYQEAYAVTSIVSLDVNPSIELKVNKNEKVISCEALNTEAQEVLRDMNGGADLEGTKLDVAVNAIVGALVRNGYLDSISSAILISVEDRDQTRAAKIQQELTAAVDVVLQERSSEAAVLSQTVEKDTAVEKQAKENNISTGKAAIIARITELNKTLDFAELAELSVEELKDLLETGAPGMPIGKADAALKAMTYAGVAHLSSTYWEVDAELDDFSPHYEVELFTSAGEFEYDVDAYTGEILRGKADVLKESDPVSPDVDKNEPVTDIKEPVTDIKGPATDTKEPISDTSAFDIAASDFYAKYPELNGSNIFNDRTELDKDDGTLHYDVEFFIGGYEVDYEIDAFTGSILSWGTDYEGPSTRPDTPETTDIGKDKAKAIALAHAGLTEAQVSRMQIEKDEDDGRIEYEIEFRSGSMEYDYTIDAKTGAVLEHEKERDD